MIRVHGQGLWVLHLVLWRWQGAVRVHRAGLGVTGTGHGVSVAVLWAGARQKVVSHPVATTDGAAVVRDAAVTSLGGVGRAESGGHGVVSLQQAGKEILSVHVCQHLRWKGAGKLIHKG